MDREETKDEAARADLSPDELRLWGERALAWIADYLREPERYPVLSPVEPGAIRARLPAAPPLRGEPMERIFEDFERVVLPGITHWNHPSFFAYFAITGSAPGILGELLTAALNVNAMLWRTSPAATELEETVLDWLRQALGLPEPCFGIIYDTASISTLCALAAAREAGTEGRVREDGLAGAAPLVLYVSDQTHSSVDKAALLLGVGRSGIRRIPTDEEYRMRVDALDEAIAADRRAGRLPFAVVATVGTTSTTSIDPVAAIADVAARHGLWLHVDAAYGGAAAIVPEMRWVLDGCERADSLVVNPHKWLFTPLDLSVLFCRRPEALRRAFSLTADYLATDEGAAVTNFMDYGIQLGRRFRALKLWIVFRHFGVEGLAAHLREHLRLARSFAAWVDADPDFERMAPTPFSTVCFRARPAGGPDDDEGLDALNEELLRAVNASGRAFLSSTRLRGRVCLRMAIGNLRTTERHVRDAWEILRRECRRLGTGTDFK